MGNLKSAKRKLKQYSVLLAVETHNQKIELVKTMLEDRIGKDATFAKEILKEIGDVLPDNLKIAAEKKVAEVEKLPDGLVFTNPVQIAF